MIALALVPLVGWMAHTLLIFTTIRHRPRKRVHQTFLAYLVAISLWCSLAFLMYANLLPGMVELVSALSLISGLFGVVAYYHFLRAFVGKPGGIGVLLGYGVLVTVIPLIVQKHITYTIRSTALGAAPQIEYTMVGLAPIVMGSLVLIGGAAVSLLQYYRHSVNPIERNKVVCLLVGLALFIALGMSNLVPALAGYPLALLGALANIMVTMFAMVKFQMLDIVIVLKRGLVYGVTGLYCIALYIALVLSLAGPLRLDSAPSFLAAGAGVAVLVAVLFYPVRDTIQELLERLNYGDTYNSRRLLLTFADKMSNVLDLDELAGYMLELVNKGIYATEVSLFLPEPGSGDFVVRFNLPVDTERNGGRLSKDNPIVVHLAQEGKPLSRDQIETLPRTKSLWEKEREQMRGAKAELLFPVRNKGVLIGILSVGKKLRSSHYRSDDLDLVMTMLGQAGVVIENAQLYAAAKMRANTDELTGLFNHRYFHERLEEEISRGLRFGVIFSLLLIDLDLFKRYNDIHGHLAGDEVLRQVGSTLRNSLRNIDKAFRYGGDEFAIILPGTSAPNAFKVAERIRRNVEEAMNSREILMTCSIGAASWPPDGVMREALVQSADSALYQAKRWGNRTCLATEIIPSSTPQPDVSSKVKQGILSTIYALAATVDARDHYTYGHSRRVSNYAVAVAEAVALPPDRVAALQTAGLLHDIGKIGISDEVLNKRSALTDEDWKPIYSHPTLGVSILKHIDGLVACLPGIQYHHEHFDGTGYPSGLRGNNIPLDARIISIADAYEAMTSPRPYRDRILTQDESLAELERNSGTQFDPELVMVFVNVIKQSSPMEMGVVEKKLEGRPI